MDEFDGARACDDVKRSKPTEQVQLDCQHQFSTILPANLLKVA